MTRNKARKGAARQRAAATGENYTAALRKTRETHLSGRAEIAERVVDPSELAEIAEHLERIPLAEFAYVQAQRAQDGRAYGGTVASGPAPNKRQLLRAREVRELNDAFGQAQRVQRVRCETCKGIVASWHHVLGGRLLPPADWARRREIWGTTRPLGSGGSSTASPVRRSATTGKGGST